MKGAYGPPLCSNAGQGMVEKRRLTVIKANEYKKD